MSISDIQDILPLVERPSRYLGTEINSIHKNSDQVTLSIALAFPDLYEIGTSHFGLQILYHILNQQKDIAAERVFAPAADMAAHLRSNGLSLQSLESSRPLARFDIIGFSLLYELNYTNMLTMLDLSGIPFVSAQRDLSYPFIIAGGPCTCNPEPVADFFDAMVIGDGESVVLEMARCWINWHHSAEKSDKTSLLRMWSNIEGVYIPSFFEPSYDPSGFQILTPNQSDYHTVSRTIVKDLNATPFPDKPIIPFGRPVHDRLRIELSRGCSRGCRFCQAGMIYRPVRERTAETLFDLCDTSLQATGYEDISMLSLSTGDYGCIVPLMEHLMTHCETDHVAVSLPSIRAGTLTPKMMQLIKKVRKTGFTIAPEAGSQRLRDVINKNISNREITDTVGNAFRLGWRVIKLYFMIGLPTETDDDLQALVDLVKELLTVKKSINAGGKINVSVTTFIPKPFTPFQWAPQLDLGESKEKIIALKRHLNLPGIHFKWQNPEVSFIEGVWSRGDRRLSQLLLSAYEKGCQFDGWSDRFKFHLWRDAFDETQIDPGFYTTRNRTIDEPLPWDHIDIKVTKTFLQKELEKSLAADRTSDCRFDDCNACGVCDFNNITPITFDTCNNPHDFIRIENDAPSYKNLKLIYQKTDQARFFGHLELMNIFLRALRRINIRLKYSQGFHPMPKISFEDPLPMGMEGLNEAFYLTVEENVSSGAITNDLNRHLPPGLLIKNCLTAPAKAKRRKSKLIRYRITLKDGFFDQNAIKYFNTCKTVVITRTSKKGKTSNIDLKKRIDSLDLQAQDTLLITLSADEGKTIRPQEVMTNIFQLTETALKRARIVKL
ncbi:TIGR03960 family B12-binding radical SAM protein [Thermodesulfobacteriota bacterium]